MSGLWVMQIQHWKERLSRSPAHLTAAIFYAQTHQFHCKLAIHFDYLTVMSGATLTTALISVTCVLVVISVLTFVIGFICGQCYVGKKTSAANKNAESSNTGPAMNKWSI